MGGNTPSAGAAGLDDNCGGALLEEDGGRLSEVTDFGGAAGGILPELAARPGVAEPRGGGGVAREEAAELGSFLLTHFFNSLS